MAHTYNIFYSLDGVCVT